MVKTRGSLTPQNTPAAAGMTPDTSDSIRDPDSDPHTVLDAEDANTDPSGREVGQVSD